MTASIIGQGTSSPTPAPHYWQYDWGDCIEGTKEQLQALGLGVGAAYPGEVGGPKRVLKIQDPRGFPAELSKRRDGSEKFVAYIHFPDWPKRPSMDAECESPFPNTKKTESLWYDEYVGSGDALATAGLVRIDQLPGAPGMRKVRVTILPDGSTVGGAATANHPAADQPGSRSIERRSASSFRIRIRVQKDIVSSRRAALEAAENAWEIHVRALPRPPKLGMCTATSKTRGHLRLVWSVPENPTSARRYTL